MNKTAKEFVIEILNKLGYDYNEEQNEVIIDIEVDQEYIDSLLCSITFDDYIEDRLYNDATLRIVDYIYDFICSMSREENIDKDSIIDILDDMSFTPRYNNRDLYKVAIYINNGDLNYDFTCHNILNYYGGYGEDKRELDSNSGLYMLAKQQGVLDELNDMLAKIHDNPDCTENPICSEVVQSYINELESLTSHMSTLSFIVKLTLPDIVKLHSMIKDVRDNKKFDRFNPNNNDIECPTITIDKSSFCGLFDPWGGGGSMLDINLISDVVVSVKNIFDIDAFSGHRTGYGYTIDGTYGLITSSIKQSVIE